MLLQITTPVIDDIERDIARHQPERGGALLGIAGKPIITHFILDSQGVTSGASYFPSPQLTQQVQQLELTQGLEFKGVIHSHPGGFDRPSGPDEEAILEGLNINPHLEFFVAPIVTLIQSRGYYDHELKLRNGKISFYVGYSQRNRVKIEQIKVQEISERELNHLHSSLPKIQVQTPIFPVAIKQELEEIRQYLRIFQTPEVFMTNLEGYNIPAGKITFKNGTELLFLFSSSHPIHAPRLLVTFPEQDTQEINLPWLMSTPTKDRLLTAIKTIEYIIEKKENPNQETETQGKLSEPENKQKPEEKNLTGSLKSSLAEV
jgi:proteasome lid subunit RPN8/RPN11